MFYCNRCEKDVDLNDGKCPICGTNWAKIINDSSSDNNQAIVNDLSNNQDFENSIITNADIYKNINFFLTWSSIVKMVTFLMAIAITIIAFMKAEDTDGYSLLLLVFAGELVLVGKILENSLKWKAYLLYTNHRRKK